MIATNISDEMIMWHDTMTGSSPGIVYVSKDEKNDLLGISNFVPSEIKSVKIIAEQLFIDEPTGYVLSNFPKTTLPDNAKRMFVYSTSSPLNLEFTDFGYFSREHPIQGTKIGATLDGRELLPSPWETIPSDLQVAFVTVFIPIFATLIGYGISKRNSINDFFDWLFSIPRYRRPVKLHDDAHIFQLTNGKKISGIIDTYEGRSTFRVFVLTEVREWDKDNWSEVLPTEVRVPQNQIEMYYKAHP